MAAKTWDTSRTGGGTYEFTQDAQGNYTLGSVGFDKLNKLNLPELKAEATTTAADTKKTTATASAQTAKAFGNVQPFYYDQKGEGGTGTQYTMRKEGDLSTKTKPIQTQAPIQQRAQLVDDYGTSKSEMPGNTGGSIKKDTIPEWARGADTRGYGNLGKEVKPLNQVNQASADVPTWARGVDTRGYGNLGKEAKHISTLNQVDQPYIDEDEKAKSYAVKSLVEKPGLKQKVIQTTKTALNTVRTSLKPLARSVGILLKPVKGAVGTAIGMAAKMIPPETPTQKHARQYFNADDQTGRISGNASTDLYAGMNVVSATGNLEKAGESRIATREETISRKGYGPGDKFYDDTQKMKDQQNNFKDSQDNNIIDKGYTRTRAERKANPGRRDADTMSGGSDDAGGGGKIICTQMYQQTHLNDWKKTIQLWYIFQKKYLTIEHQKGYHFLFKPFVSGMKKSKILTAIGKHCAIARTKDIKHIMFGTPFSLSGRLVRLITEPICYITGKIKSWL